jgi:hypothetical protein
LLKELRYRPRQWIAPTTASTRSRSPIVVHASQDKYQRQKLQHRSTIW